MPNIFQEWGNQNSQRCYPFQDTATLSDAAGNALPVDFLIDAMLYPFDLQGQVYLAAIDGAARTITLADSATGLPVGVADWNDTSAYGFTEGNAVVLDPQGRQIGILVFGDGIAQLTSNTVRTFAADATPLVPSCFVGVNQVGVRGIVLPDGTVVTGDVTFEGQDGVVVTTEVDSGVNTLRVDVVGVPAATIEDCSTLGAPICTIKVIRKAGSAFQITQYDDYTLGLTLNGLSLDQICAAAKARRRAAINGTITGNDPCGPSPAPTPVDPGIDQEIDFNICALGSGTFVIAAPSTPDYLNPIQVTPVEGVGTGTNQLAAGSITTADAAVQKFTEPPMPAGGVQLAIQGIGKGQTP